jgi:hypothetical protein
MIYNLIDYSVFVVNIGAQRSSSTGGAVDDSVLSHRHVTQKRGLYTTNPGGFVDSLKSLDRSHIALNATTHYPIIVLH